MKKLVVVFLCFFASNTFASSADSGRCPWKIPFSIVIHGIGSNSSFTRADDSILSDTRENWDTAEDLDITIDTNSGFFFNGYTDLLIFGQDQDSLIHPSIYVRIEFVYGTDSIASIAISQDEVRSYFDSFDDDNYYFKISLLEFDGNSIFATDSSFGKHNIFMSHNNIDSQYDRVNGSSMSLNSDFTSTSVTLSGIFRPTTFSDPPSIVTEAPQPNNFAIYSSNGSIACSFDVADHPRNLEIFSPLGIREANFSIPAGQMEASLPHLLPGFYFVRMGDAMAKIYITQ